MAKYSGIIGFGIMQETNPSVYEETIVEKSVVVMCYRIIGNSKALIKSIAI